jgi:hypothetical protein
MARPFVLAPVLTAALVASAIIALALFGHTPFSDTEAARRTAGAKAFARVHSDGQFDAKRSRNVRGVTRQEQGVYCLDLAMGVKNVVASLSGGTVGVASGGLELVDANSTCPDETEVFVVTSNLSGNRADAPFYVVMN